jgi:hypothetical protein
MMRSCDVLPAEHPAATTTSTNRAAEITIPATGQPRSEFEPLTSYQKQLIKQIRNFLNVL